MDIVETKTAVFGGGCFWCTEAAFMMVRGVIDVVPGYAGGKETGKVPTYDEVCDGTTGHAEVIQVIYDPKEISYNDILTVFFASHDPTTLNRQGSDVGTQYRSIILYENNSEKDATEKYIATLNAQGGAPVVTEVTPLTRFYPAETYHQNFYARNRENQYCQLVIDPKLVALREKLGPLLKK